MSCLYPSPEVTSLEVESLEWSLPSSLRASGVPIHRVVNSRQIFRTSRRFPNSASTLPPAASKLFCLPKQARVSCVSFQAQYQAFVRFAVGSSAALSAIALN
jgi:hypothetical protein